MKWDSRRWISLGFTGNFVLVSTSFVWHSRIDFVALNFRGVEFVGFFCSLRVCCRLLLGVLGGKDHTIDG